MQVQPLPFPASPLAPILSSTALSHFYTNDRENCDIHDENSILEVSELIVDEEVLDNIKYSNSCDRLKYRGLLYCTPDSIDIDNYDLRRA